MKLQVEGFEGPLHIIFRYRHSKHNVNKIYTSVSIKTEGENIIASGNAVNVRDDIFHKIAGRRIALLKAFKKENFDRKTKVAICRALSKRGVRLG